VRNACFTYLRERQGRAEQSGTSDAALEAHQLAAGLTAPDPATLVEGQDLRARIDGAIAALPPLLRQMIVLREIEGMEYAEIAAIEAIPIGTVMSRLARARSNLKALLSQVDSPD
jgi:RNA polymerase sigma-70 factor (ECF subfamily)